MHHIGAAAPKSIPQLVFYLVRERAVHDRRIHDEKSRRWRNGKF
jgi:hypothetical protein